MPVFADTMPTNCLIPIVTRRYVTLKIVLLPPTQTRCIKRNSTYWDTSLINGVQVVAGSNPATPTLHSKNKNSHQKRPKNRPSDHLSYSNSHACPHTELDHLISGFILDCRINGKTQRTLEFYNDNLSRFQWWLSHNKLSTDINSVGPDIIRVFLAYIQQEPHRWGSSNPHANRKASHGQ